MIEESKYCTHIRKKHLNKELVMTNKDDEDFENSTKCLTSDNVYADGDVKVRDHCHITGKYKASAHRDCNIKVKVNHKIHIEFQNLKNYDSYLFMQELSKFNCKINVIPNGLEKHIRFNINTKLNFIDNLQSLSSSLDTLIKSLGKDDFKYLSQEFDIHLLDLVKQKGLCPYEYMIDYEKFKEELPSKEKFYGSLAGQQISDKEYEHVLKVWNTCQMKAMKDYHDLYFKCDVLLLTVFKKCRNSSLKKFGLCTSHYLSAPA